MFSHNMKWSLMLHLSYYIGLLWIIYQLYSVSVLEISDIVSYVNLMYSVIGPFQAEKGQLLNAYEF